MVNNLECSLSKKCGNCPLGSHTYQETIKIKQDYVNKLFKDASINKKIDNMSIAQNNIGYRNKMIIGFKKYNGKILAGFYEENSHKIIDLDYCPLHTKEQNKIAQAIKNIIIKLRLPIYDEDRKTGLIRFALIRESFSTKEILVTIITASENFPARSEFVKLLRESSDKIKTIVQNINSRSTSIVLGEKERVLYGPGFINDELLDLKFQITSKSFYQVNPSQTVILYQTVEKLAKLNKNDVLLDAYSGVGTIGLYLSKKVKQVISVENNLQAVNAAIANAKVNHISNDTFILDDATNFITNVDKKSLKIDVLVMDPPRTGSTIEFLKATITLSPRQIIYVSCGPDTLVRDLKYLLRGGYKIDYVHCVDMFCWTNHIETVVLLQKKDSNN